MDLKAQGIDHIVNSAMIMEVPDIFLHVNRSNLLITTLFPIYDDEKVLIELIPKLHALEVAGICINPFRYINGIFLK